MNKLKGLQRVMIVLLIFSGMLFWIGYQIDEAGITPFLCIFFPTVLATAGFGVWYLTLWIIDGFKSK